jgi:hypothetical protein
MSEVVFSFGSRPTLSAEDAQMLAQLIVADPTPFTAKLASKINRALLNDETASEIELEQDELAEIADALSADPELLLDVPEFKPLHEEITEALQPEGTHRVGRQPKS